MKLVKNILDSKGNDIWQIAPDDSVLEAVRVMAEKGVGALLVMDNAKLVGIVSERDYARKVILQGRSSENTPVRDIMTAEVVCARPEQTVEECMLLMTENHIRHLPVVRDDKTVGVGFGVGEFVRAGELLTFVLVFTCVFSLRLA